MVFENLIDNAIKYTPERKNIVVEARQSFNHAEVNIIDEGVGILAKDIEKLFTKFTRIPNTLSVEAGGTGLGLYWAERIVKLHKGKIVIKSTIGKGSTFSVHLPLARKFFTVKAS
jgi:signal transduction histidine kinase